MRRKDLMWRGEEIIVENNSFINIVIDGLNQVFKHGFMQNDLDRGILSEIFKPLPENYITASSAKCFGNNFIGQDNEFFSAGTYGYVYLMANENVTRVSLPKDKGGYAIVSKVDPRFIIGAMPSAFIAFALGIPERSFIKSPDYKDKEILDLGKLKDDLEISMFSERNALTLKYPNLSVESVYEKFLEAESKLAIAQSYSEAMTGGNSTFFQRVPSISGLDSSACSQLKF